MASPIPPDAQQPALKHPAAGVGAQLAQTDVFLPAHGHKVGIV